MDNIIKHIDNSENVQEGSLVLMIHNGKIYKTNLAGIGAKIRFLEVNKKGIKIGSITIDGIRTELYAETFE